MNGAVSFAGAWLLVIVAAIALSSTRWGKPIVYYMLWLAVLLLLVSHSQELNDLLIQGGIIKTS